jgi:hypothetical protein
MNGSPRDFENDRFPKTVSDAAKRIIASLGSDVAGQWRYRLGEQPIFAPSASFS